MSELHEQLRDLRKRRGLTLRELAPLVGRSITTISQLEQGKVDTPLRQASAWANALGADLVVVERRDGVAREIGRALAGLDEEGLALVLHLAQLLPKMTDRDRAGLQAELSIIERF